MIIKDKIRKMYLNFLFFLNKNIEKEISKYTLDKPAIFDVLFEKDLLKK